MSEWVKEWVSEWVSDWEREREWERFEMFPAIIQWGFMGSITEPIYCLGHSYSCLGWCPWLSSSTRSIWIKFQVFTKKSKFSFKMSDEKLFCFTPKSQKVQCSKWGEIFDNDYASHHIIKHHPWACLCFTGWLVNILHCSEARLSFIW